MSLFLPFGKPVSFSGLFGPSLIVAGFFMIAIPPEPGSNGPG
jgi:hypothetical protein